jgi:protein-L-isoaspartate(D-aspartate) O-methyltransferase
MDEDRSYAAEREAMVKNQILARGIRDGRVLEAMRLVPRHRFVQPENRSFAYADGPLPIGHGQTISQPYIVALMSELLQLTGEEKVLEIGTGSGYQAAILAQLARQVYTVERHAELANRSAALLDDLGYANVIVQVGDGSLGLHEMSPFNAIIVTAAAPSVPQALLDQLDLRGRLVIPVGARGAQFLERWERQGVKFNCETVLPVAFVPLVGRFGWKEYSG